MAIRNALPAGPRLRHQRRVDLARHGSRDAVALGDVVDRKLHHPVPYAVPDRVEHDVLDLLLAAQLPEDVGRLHRIDLPPDRHIHLHPHLLARQRTDLLRLVARGRELLLAGGEALHVGPGRHEAHAGQQRTGVHLAEGVADADLTRVDHDDAAGEEEEGAEGGEEPGTGAEHAWHSPRRRPRSGGRRRP